jgi:Transposase DDE domain
VTAIAEWATDAPWPVLAALGVRGDPLTRRCQVPGEATIRRVLARVDGDAVDATVGAWLADRLRPLGHRRVLAVDGKRLRGSARSGHQVHLLAATDHYDGAVLAQREVPAASNEIAEFQPLLADLDLAGAIVTADALHTQRDHASFLVGRGAGYLLVVKANQPSPARPARQPAVAADPGDGPHPRARPRPHRASDPEGRRRRRPVLPARRPGDPVIRRVRAPGSRR